MLATSHSDRIEAARRAVGYVAREQGLRFDEAVVLRDGSNTLVHLRPAPVVARTPAVTSTVRQGDGWLAREVAVAGFLAAAGAPVVGPTDLIHPGPHRHDGRVMSFWNYVEEVAYPVDPVAAGRGLRLCHDILSGFEGGLAQFSALKEAEDILTRYIAKGAIAPADADLLQRTAARLNRRVRQLNLPPQPIHGDSHLHNVLSTPAGSLWGDWEDTFIGPIGWDLACLVTTSRIFGTQEERTSAALEAYGSIIKDEDLDLLVQARAFQAAVWGIAFVKQQVGSEARLRMRLEWLRHRA